MHRPASQRLRAPIASITMMDQFPHGIDLHVRNLRSMLTGDDHSFVVTPPRVAAELGLVSEGQITCIAHRPADHCHNIMVGGRFFPPATGYYGSRRLPPRRHKVPGDFTDANRLPAY